MFSTANKFTFCAVVFALATIAGRAQPAPATVAVMPKSATLLPLSANWQMDGDIPKHALEISLQGLANRTAPRIYLEYPKNWQWEIVRPLETFLEKRHGLQWDRLAEDDVDGLLNRYSSFAKGYVVWDDKVRPSLIVAFTVAGIMDAVVIDEQLIPLAEKHGLHKLVDFRGKFEGMKPVQIYQWAFDEYWARCSRDYYVLLGGQSGTEMQPGIADFGIRQHAFFTDLSANPRDVEERALESKILSLQHPSSIVMGWHSYGKDTEGTHTTLVGNYGLKMEGLHNIPNVSFTCQVPLTKDFHFENNHPAKAYSPVKVEQKVYITAISTDSIGVGAWTKAGRGSIPYAWQVMMNWSWMNPAALQYFYESKTPNDYFIGGLSGPGYMYPKAIPAAKFPGLMKDARDLMKTLDLQVLEIMDYSEGNRHIGNNDLPEDLANRYHKEFPGILGFVNGYGTARTFDNQNGQPLISYDYYLDQGRPEAEVAADLDELVHLNVKRPYFMLVHVREGSSLERVSSILKQMNEPNSVVPLDVFLEIAGKAKTYQTRYEETGDPIYSNH